MHTVGERDDEPLCENSSFIVLDIIVSTVASSRGLVAMFLRPETGLSDSGATRVSAPAPEIYRSSGQHCLQLAEGN